MLITLPCCLSSNNSHFPFGCLLQHLLCLAPLTIHYSRSQEKHSKNIPTLHPVSKSPLPSILHALHRYFHLMSENNILEIRNISELAHHCLTYLMMFCCAHTEYITVVIVFYHCHDKLFIESSFIMSICLNRM